MARFGLCSGAYASQSVDADAQICLNWYPEADESGQGKSAAVLYQRGGLKLFATCPDQPHRRSLEINGRLFCVSGSTLFEISTTGVATARGTVGNDNNPASLATSATQLVIASAGNVYCLTLATNAFVGPITGLTGANQVGFIDGFFIAKIGTSQQFFVSNVGDGSTWDLSSTAIVSVFPGNVVSMITDHRELCLLGERQSVCYYDSGNLFPFDVVPAGFMEQGSGAAFGTSKLDNTYLWWGKDELGGRIAWRANGYTPVRISTHAIENELRGYSTISDAVSFSCQSNGHTFWVTQFPSADKTWVYDVATQQWSQWTYFSNGVNHAFLGISHVYAFSKHLIGDRQSGNLYQMDDSLLDDAGSAISCIRRAPYIAEESQRIQFVSFELEIESGLGPNIPLTDGAGNARDPQIMLRWSDDGGKNWKGNRILNAGQLGKFTKRLRAFGLGSCWGTKGRIFEISKTDAFACRVIDGYVQAIPDMGPTPRLSAKLRSQA
jgi:hypothetical protein